MLSGSVMGNLWSGLHHRAAEEGTLLIILVTHFLLNQSFCDYFSILLLDNLPIDLVL